MIKCPQIACFVVYFAQKSHLDPFLVLDFYLIASGIDSKGFRKKWYFNEKTQFFDRNLDVKHLNMDVCLRNLFYKLQRATQSGKSHLKCLKSIVYLIKFAQKCIFCLEICQFSDNFLHVEVSEM